jgi:ribonucleoside-diphosphate reductase alpha chain
MGGGMAASGMGATGNAGQGGYVATPNLPEPEIVGKACTLRPGDPGFEECEACQ